MALRRLREGLSPLSSAVRLERVRLPLLTFGRVLDADQVAALPAGARAVVEDGRVDRLGPYDGPLHAPLRRRHAFIEVPRLEGRLTTLVDLPLEQREAPFRELGREIASSRNVFVRLSLSQPDFNQLGAMVDQQRAQADLLLALALVRAHRERSGTWPSALPSLFPERDVLLPTALTLQPGEAGTLVLVPEEATLQRLASALGKGIALQGLSGVLRP